jgi:hypothetical protein
MLTIVDAILSPFYILLLYLVVKNRQHKYIDRFPYYKYYVWGFWAKIAGGIGVCLIYTLYYNTGDTTTYFYEGACVLKNLFYKSPGDFFTVLFGERNYQNWMLFDNTTAWPQFYRDPNAFFMIRLTAPLSIITFGSYVSSAILLSWFCYTGIWRLFIVFCEEFPKYTKQIAIAILFVPSVFFWGSGILKDAITLSAVGWYTYSFYNACVKKQNIAKNIIYIILSCFFIISIKPYILYVLIPGSLIWLSISLIKIIDNKFLRSVITPLALVFFIGSGYLILLAIGDSFGKFSPDNILNNAVVTQQDLKQQYYGGNSYDIGDFNASISSILLKAPVAIIYGLFRPFLWDVRNPVMLISAIENTYILLLFIYVLLTVPITFIIHVLRNKPLLFFSLLFVLFFSFSVGLTTANFGALVRYRIPVIPFFMATLLILKEEYKGRERGVLS